MNPLKSILITGAFLVSAGMQAASAGTVKHYEGDIPYETVKFLSPYTAFFKGDPTGILERKTAKSKDSEEITKPKAEVRFPEKTRFGRFKTFRKGNLGNLLHPSCDDKCLYF